MWVNLERPSVGARMKGVVKWLLLALSVAAAATLALSLALPAALYSYGLEIVPGRPAPSAQEVSEERIAETWQMVEGDEEIVVEPMDPWTPLWRFFAESRFPHRWRGESACTYIAGGHVHERLGRIPSWKRHIATYSITVWISRHWSPEQIAREIALIEERRLRQG